MNKSIAGNHREMVARPGQRRQFAPAIARRVIDFVRGDRDFVDSPAANRMYLPVQYGNTHRAARTLERRTLTPAITRRVVFINPIDRITMPARGESAYHVDFSVQRCRRSMG